MPATAGDGSVAVAGSGLLTEPGLISGAAVHTSLCNCRESEGLGPKELPVMSVTAACRVQKLEDYQVHHERL